MSTIPPLVCNTPPPIEDLDSDEDISGANDSQFEHYDEETPSPSPKHIDSTLSGDSFSMVDKQIDIKPDIDIAFHQLNQSSNSILKSEPNTNVDSAVEDPITFNSDSTSENEIDTNVNKSKIVLDTRYTINESSSTFVDNEIVVNAELITNDKFNNVEELTESDAPILPQSESDLNGIEKYLAKFETNEINAEITHEKTFDWDGKLESKLGHKILAEELNLSSEIDSNKSNEIYASETLVQSDEIIDSFVESVESEEICDEKVAKAEGEEAGGREAEVEAAEKEEKVEEEVEAEEEKEEDGNENENEQNDNLDGKFDADFSQFTCFESVPISSSPPEDIPKHNIDSNEEVYLTPSARESSENFADFNNDENDGNDDEDDDFGDFNDFQQTTELPQQYNDIVNEQIGCANIERDLDNILSNMFPYESDRTDDGNSQFDNIIMKEMFMNELTNHLKNVENSKALTHQWAKSVAKTFLVRALGIDSRNILYGEKWNCSAPKFAANLGMSPLEPMKLRAATCSNDTENKTQKATIDVPAAQFDWNSSGLINPLDALHAHTLLLDLDQLVVVANLDKINLNSSSSSSSSTCNTTNLVSNYTSSSSSSSSIITVTESKTVSKSTHRSSSYQHDTNYLLIDNKQIKTNYSNHTNGMYSIVNQTRNDANYKSTVMGNPNQMDSFDSFFRSRKNVHEENNVPLETKKRNQECEKPIEPISKDLASPTLPPEPASLSATNIAHLKLNEIQLNGLDFDNMEPIQTSDSYTVPGSSGTMKETHIFTPSISEQAIDIESQVINSNETLNTGDDVESVVIKENVVKKEYRDVEYDPDKIVITSDEFSEFQFVNAINPASIPNDFVTEDIQSVQTKCIIPTLEPVSSIEFTLNNSENGLSNHHISNNVAVMSKNALDTFKLPISDLKVIELDNKNMQSNQTENEKPVNDSVLTKIQDNSDSVLNIAQTHSTFVTDIHSTMAKTIINDKPNNVLSINTSILTPLPISGSIVNNSQIKSPQIEWPEPGIDSDQLMRFEQRCGHQSAPEKNGKTDTKTIEHTDDDEWSDFVSVVQPQTPITNILSKNLLKQQNDEDDWSEFVSSTVPTNIQRNIPNSSFNNIVSNAWDGITTPNLMRNSIQSSVYNVPISQKTNYLSPSQSISSLPDLGFAAPTSLVHMPRTSLTKK